LILTGSVRQAFVTPVRAAHNTPTHPQQPGATVALWLAKLRAHAPTIVHSHSGRPIPFTAHPSGRDSIVVAWCREIAAALDVDVEHATYRFALGVDLPVPRELDTAFHTGGHPVAVTVV